MALNELAFSCFHSFPYKHSFSLITAANLSKYTTSSRLNLKTTEVPDLTKILLYSAENIQTLRRTRKGWKKLDWWPKCVLRSEPGWRLDFHPLERHDRWPTQHQHGRPHLLFNNHLWKRLSPKSPTCLLYVQSQYPFSQPGKWPRRAQQIPSILEVDLRDHHWKDSDCSQTRDDCQQVESPTRRRRNVLSPEKPLSLRVWVPVSAYSILIPISWANLT